MNTLTTLIVITFIALLAAGIAVLLSVLVWRAWRAGLFSVRGQAFDRKKQPGFFWLMLSLYAFIATTSACFSVFLVTLILRYGLR